MPCFKMKLLCEETMSYLLKFLKVRANFLLTENRISGIMITVILYVKERKIFYMRFDLQKANMWKRISAFILDMILLCIVMSGAMLALSAITGYDSHAVRLEQYYTDYAQQYQIEKFDITEDDYNAMSEDERAAYQRAYEALLADDEVLETYSMVVNLTILTVSLGIFFAYAALEFVVPLLFGNGQTVGKKVFGIGVIRCDGVKMNTFMLFVRTLLGKYTVETMIPVLLIVMLMFNTIGFTGILVIGLILLLQLILLIVTKNRTVIHDAFAQTVVVDMASQRIFDSPEELLAHKTRLAAERAAKEAY